MIYSNHNALLEKGQNFQSLIYPHWQLHNSRNNVSKATSEWRVVMSVEPSPLLWFMGGGSNKNGNQISPATLQVVGCLIKLSKAWLGFRMIIPRNQKRGPFPLPTRTPFISCCVLTPLWYISKITAHLLLMSLYWRLFVVWRTPLVKIWWIPCTQTGEHQNPD